MPFIFIGFLIIYLLVCFYIAYNGWVWLSKSFGFVYKKSYYVFMFFLSISFILNRIVYTVVFEWLGYIWLIIFGAGCIILPIFNAIYFLSKKTIVKSLGISFIAIQLFIISFGSYNIWSPVVVSYDVEINKQTDLEGLKILLISDIHISELIGKNFLNKLITLSTEVNPDIIFLAGDVIDSSIDPYLENNLGEILSGLTAPMGVYAVLGNHEYYGNDIPIFLEEMDEINVKVLLDEVVNIDDLFYIVGRKDNTDKKRKSIYELADGLDLEKPVLAIDHQPKELDDISTAGVDLVVSGHTHKGQIFPGNLITKALYENHYGHYVRENLNSIVSSGYGIWGPPFRIGSRSEIVEINVKFD